MVCLESCRSTKMEHTRVMDEPPDHIVAAALIPQSFALNQLDAAPPKLNKLKLYFNPEPGENRFDVFSATKNAFDFAADVCSKDFALCDLTRLGIEGYEYHEECLAETQNEELSLLLAH
jgi:hypothetical protein